jgi:hypothetical protein
MRWGDCDLTIALLEKEHGQCLTSLKIQVFRIKLC